MGDSHASKAQACYSRRAFRASDPSLRRTHFETLRPLCPACRALRGLEVPLSVASVLREEGEHVVEGALGCGSCGEQYPIVDGVPLLLADLPSYVASGGLTLPCPAALAPRPRGHLGPAR